ncbi:MAG: hypothetical protein JWN94_190 [Betaproteobacteria bacterium]|nr:hypothetical protein [Betaproteobacteria bacterium]
MDDKTYRERVSRLEEIGKILEKLPSEIRATAFTLLQDYVVGHLHAGGKPPAELVNPGNTDAAIDRGVFFAKYSHEKPADNLKSIAAYLFSEYGAEPFSIDEIRQLAEDVGLTIPERPDMTFINALEDGKKLFTRAGRGQYRPTVHGEAFVKTTYSVKKGTKKREPDVK